jgi:hypothetical protein
MCKFMHRPDVRTAKILIDRLPIETEDAANPIEREGSAFHDAIDAGLGDPEEEGDFVDGEEVGALRRGFARISVHIGLLRNNRQA